MLFLEMYISLKCFSLRASSKFIYPLQCLLERDFLVNLVIPRVLSLLPTILCFV